MFGFIVGQILNQFWLKYSVKTMFSVNNMSERVSIVYGMVLHDSKVGYLTHTLAGHCDFLGLSIGLIWLGLI